MPAPNIPPAPNPGAGFNSTPVATAGLDKLQVIIGYVAWGADAACIIALIVVGATMAIQHQRGEQPAGGLGRVALGATLIGGASTFGGTFMGFNLFNSDPQAIPGLTTVQTIIGMVAYVAAGVCVIGLIVAGVRMAMSHRRGEPIGEGLASVAGGCLLVGSAAGLVGLFI